MELGYDETEETAFVPNTYRPTRHTETVVHRDLKPTNSTESELFLPTYADSKQYSSEHDHASTVMCRSSRYGGSLAPYHPSSPTIWANIDCQLGDFGSAEYATIIR